MIELGIEDYEGQGNDDEDMMPGGTGIPQF